MSVTTQNAGTTVITPVPYDIALNVAVHCMANAVYPNGYDVLAVGDVPVDLTQAQYQASHQGRTAIRAAENPAFSLFADLEIENDFRAVMEWALYHPTTLGGRDMAEPGLSALEIAAATIRVEEKLVQLYGREERTEAWARDLATYFLANVGYGVFRSIKGVSPTEDWDHRQVFDRVKKSHLGSMTAEECREEFVAYLVHKAMEFAGPPVYVVNSEEELTALLQSLAMPADETGQQNAPTSAARN